MDKQLIDNIISYVRKELTSIHHDLKWADGTEAESFRVRQMRLLAELDRLESLRRLAVGPVGVAIPISAAAANAAPTGLTPNRDE